MTSVLLTGATGLLGQYLLKDLLLSGQQVAVLVRSTEGISARQRIDVPLRYFESQLGRTLPRPRILEGNLQVAGLGLTSLDRRWLANHCTSVLHCAASVQFRREPTSDEPFRSNVTGTRYLVELCAESGIREFHYISTAYVSGDRKDTILETELDRGQKFRNDYEQSKFTAEQLLRNASGLGSLTIYRPSIIVGDSQTGYTSTFHGFYLPLQLVYGAARSGLISANELGYLPALGLEGVERKNLVPVDWVSQVSVRIFREARLHNQTYHLANPNPPTTGDIQSSIGEAIRRSLADQLATRPPAPLPDSLREEFRSQMGVYAAYLGGDPVFDTTHISRAAPDCVCPRMDRAALVHLAEFAIRANFGWPRLRPAPLTFDLEPWLTKLPHAEAPVEQEQLQLEVSGSGGGVWNVSFTPSGPCLTDCPPRHNLAVYLNIHTFRELLEDKGSLAQQLAAGRLLIEGPKAKIRAATALLEVLLKRLRGSE